MELKLDNQFLVAMPNMRDEYFQQSVIYICEHTEKGAMGLIINQPSDLSVAELTAKMNFMMADGRKYSDQLVLNGGPVNIERGFILHRPTEQRFEHSYAVSDNLRLTTSIDVVHTFGTVSEPEKYLVALGCASWKANQLEQEIAENAWLVAPADEFVLFDLPYEERWQAAQRLLNIEPYNFILRAGRS